MLTYDYTIKRSVGQGKVQEFVPNLIPKTFNSNIISIEGPNSSGKSTLLNIIALGLYGTKNSKVNPVLQAKLKSLNDSNHQKLKFFFEISVPSDSSSIKVSKDNFDGQDILVEEKIGGKYKPISPESFERKYNLIYDIPSNPTERLADLLRELKDDQILYGNKFNNAADYLRKTITQISTSRDTNRLNFVKAQIAERKIERQKLLDEEPKQKELIDTLEKAAYLRYYYYYQNECQRLKDEHERVSEKIKKFGDDGKKISSKLKQLKSKCATTTNVFRARFNEVTPLIDAAISKSERSRFKIWKNINPYQLDIDNLNTTKIEALFYSELIGNDITRIQNQSAYKDATVLQRVLTSIEQYEHSGLVLTKLSVTLGDLIKALKEEYDKSSITVKQYQTLSHTLELLSAIVNDTDELISLNEEISEESVVSQKFAEGATETYYGEKAELSQVETDLEKALSKVSAFYERCCSIGFDENALSKPYTINAATIFLTPEAEQYLKLSEAEITSKIAGLKQTSSKRHNELSALNLFLSNYERELEKLEKQEPHKYEKYKNQLLELLQKTEAISSKILSDNTTNLVNLINKKIKQEDVGKDEEKRRYYNEVSKYLAFRIGNFRHIDKIYTAKIVDLISEKIVTEDDTTIYITDMGTGQSQSAYLLGLLNLNDDRKIIALFDEIAMMDEISLQPIYERLKELQKNSKLLLGILVQKSNQISIRSIE
jgi:DNA repair protein SbcC/Rad50